MLWYYLPQMLVVCRRDDMDQWVIVILGTVTIWLTQRRELSWRRWACILGTLNQPFWLYSTWKAGQMGMFVMAIFTTLIWFQGIWTYWIAKEEVKA